MSSIRASQPSVRCSSLPSSPRRRWAYSCSCQSGARAGALRKLVDEVAALSGVGVAAGAFVGLLISEHTPLFGFMEHGYRFAIVLALASEAVAIAMLTLFVVRGPHPSWRSGTASRQELSGAGQPRVAPGTER